MFKPGMGGARSSGMFNNIANMIGGGGRGGRGGRGGIPFFGQDQNTPFMPSGPQPPPSADNIFKMLNIRNLLPIGTAGINKNVFDLVKDDTFVKKIKKSNYAETVKKLQGQDKNLLIRIFLLMQLP